MGRVRRGSSGCGRTRYSIKGASFMPKNMRTARGARKSAALARIGADQENEPMTVISQSAPPVLGPAPMGSILPLRLDDVGYSAGGKALIEHVSFEIGAGPRTVMLGPNGAGKSLILRLCHGLIRPTSGRVLWLGPDGRHPRPHLDLACHGTGLLARSAGGI